MEELHTDKYGIKKDNSMVEVPFNNKMYGDFKLALDIFEYTLGEKKFNPIENTLDIDKEICLERLANFEFLL